MRDVERAARRVPATESACFSALGCGCREHVVPRAPHHPHARDYLGEELAVVLLHGFPDSQHL